MESTKTGGFAPPSRASAACTAPTWDDRTAGNLGEELLLELRHERVVEMQVRRGEQNKPAFQEFQKSGLFGVVERRTAVDVVVRSHEIPRFHRVSTRHRGDSVRLAGIPPFLHFHFPEILVFALFDLLQTEKVAISGAELMHESISAIAPFQCPERTIRVQIGLAIHVRKHVIGCYGNRGSHHVGEKRTGDPLAWRRVAGR